MTPTNRPRSPGPGARRPNAPEGAPVPAAAAPPGPRTRPPLRPPPPVVRTGRRPLARPADPTPEPTIAPAAAPSGEAPPPIDPRIRERRVAVAREQGRLRLHRLLVGLAVASGLGVLAGAVYSPVLGLRHLRVVGAQRTPEHVVASASGLHRGEPLASVRAAAVAARIRALPWVAGVTVHVSWPGTVSIRIHERTPVATVPTDQACGSSACRAVVDAGGRVTAVVDVGNPLVGQTVAVDGVPAAGGPATTVPDAGRTAIGVAVALPPSLRPQVSAVVAGAGGLALRLRSVGANPPVVLLGSADRLTDELTSAATVVAQVRPDGLSTIDVRVPEAPTVTRANR